MPRSRTGLLLRAEPNDAVSADCVMFLALEAIILTILPRCGCRALRFVINTTCGRWRFERSLDGRTVQVKLL